MSEVTDFDLGNIVSRETMESLLLFEGLVRKWNPAINLVSADSLSQLRTRHIVDSIQIYKHASSRDGLWCDLGSGGGFPGLVVAILAREDSGKFKVKLVESDGRKAAFLMEAARLIGLDVEVVRARIEDLPPLSASVLSARALAPLPKLCAFAFRHLDPRGVALFCKGARHEDEILIARKQWQVALEIHPSETGGLGVVLEMRNVRRDLS